MPVQYNCTEAFLESFIHKKHIVMNRTLLPFCLRHWFLLMALEHPLTHGGVWNLEDVRLAVLIFSTASNEEFFAAAKFDSWYWKLWKSYTKTVPSPRHRQLIYEYLDDYFPNYPFWVSGKSETETKAPPFLVAASRLLTCCTRDEVMNMPLGELMAWNLAKNETEPVPKPNANLMTDAEAEAVALINQLEQEQGK